MPYAPKFERALQGLAHGMKPRSKSLKKISPHKARSMLSEAKSSEARSRSRHEGQLKALRSMR